MRAYIRDTALDEDASIKRTILILVWAFTTSIWSIFTQPHKTFPARVLVFQPLWILRIYLRDATWLQDVLLFLCAHALYTHWNGSWRFFTPSDFTWIDLHDRVMLLYFKTFGLLGGCGALAAAIVHRGHHLKSAERKEPLLQSPIDEQLLPPLLIPSRTMHTRLFPEKHGFSYTYLFVGIPVGIKGAVGNALSVDSQQRNWFHVGSSDYLARDGARLDLGEKLKRYLHTQGITDRDYAFAYLVTAPRFLGYSFNPVSFWYLYDSDTLLKYMILEVNNTFDERRMYLLRADDGKQSSTTQANGHSTTKPDDSLNFVFTDTWDKDFHVSPFNSRKGSYSLRAVDPLTAYQDSGNLRIDNTIVLRSSKESPKIVTRVWSEGNPREAVSVCGLELATFIAQWWWVGLATFPRIVWQAQKLFFQRKLHVWYRPEVTDTSVGRPYTDDERQLETFFQAFLKDSIERSSKAIRVTYEAAHADGEEIVFYSPSFTYEEDSQRTLTLQVSSPAFYSRFVHYAHAKEAFDREGLATDEKNRTIVFKNATLLPILLDSFQDTGTAKPRNDGPLEQIRWSLLRRLRCPPPDASYTHHAVDSEYMISDIRSFQRSELDAFVRVNCSDAAVYRKRVTKLFLAQRLAFGFPVLASALDGLLRTVLILTALYFCDQWRYIDVVRPREFGPKEILPQDVSMFAMLLLLANAVHLWSFVKG